MGKRELDLGALMNSVTNRVADAIEQVENNPTPLPEQDQPAETDTTEVIAADSALSATPEQSEQPGEFEQSEQPEPTATSPVAAPEPEAPATPAPPTTPATSLSTIATIQQTSPRSLAAAIDPDILGYNGTTQGVNIALPEDIYDAMKVLKERYYKETRIRINYSNIISQALRNLTEATLKDM